MRIPHHRQRQDEPEQRAGIQPDEGEDAAEKDQGQPRQRHECHVHVHAVDCAQPGRAGGIENSEQRGRGAPGMGEGTQHAVGGENSTENAQDGGEVLHRKDGQRSGTQAMHGQAKHLVVGSEAAGEARSIECVLTLANQRRKQADVELVDGVGHDHGIPVGITCAGCLRVQQRFAEPQPRQAQDPKPCHLSGARTADPRGAAMRGRARKGQDGEQSQAPGRLAKRSAGEGKKQRGQRDGWCRNPAPRAAPTPRQPDPRSGGASDPGIDRHRQSRGLSQPGPNPNREQGHENFAAPRPQSIPSAAHQRRYHQPCTAIDRELPGDHRAQGPAHEGR